MATRVAPRVRFSSERWFFCGMALVMAATVFVGFAPTYFLAALNDAPTPPLTLDVHLHGALATGWILLLVAQAGLVAARRTDIHRIVGVAGTAVAAGVLVSGVLVALDSHRRVHTDATAGTLADPHVFLVFPLVGITLFGLFAAIGVANRRRPDHHKRWMLLATISLIGPAIARIVTRTAPAVPGAIGALVLINLFLAALAVWDLRTRGRLHSVTLWGGGFLLLSEPLRIAIGFTRPWHDFAFSLMG